MSEESFRRSQYIFWGH